METKDHTFGSARFMSQKEKDFIKLGMKDIMMNDEQALLDQQAKELQQLRDYRKRVRSAFEVVDASAKSLHRDSQVAVDGAALSRLGLLIEFGES